MPATPEPVRHVGDDERRARLARRHGLAPGQRHGSALAAARAMTVLHATEAASVHLAVRARTEGVTVADVDAALYDDRSLVKQMAMRRTIFAFPRDLLPAAWASTSARVAGQEERRLAKDVAAQGLASDGDTWLAEACAAVECLLAEQRGGLTQAEVRSHLPDLDVKVSVAPGTKWGQEVPVVPRLLTLLTARGVLTRGPNRSHWRRSAPSYVLTSSWLPDGPLRDHTSAIDGAAGWRELVARWLRTFGPGTERDVQWWLGGTLGAVRTAFAELGAVPVSLDGGHLGWLLPDDVDPMAAVEPWAALLPVLDPTTMGWKQRDFYLGPHAPVLVDSVGNAGTTAWWDGRIVGGWYQRDDGSVVVVPAEDVPAVGLAALEADARRLEEWVDGEKVHTIYGSSLVKDARARE